MLESIQRSRRPQPAAGQAAHILRESWGLKASVRDLAGERDRNLLVEGEDGERYVLRFTNPAEDRAVSELQTAALLYIAKFDTGLPVPRLLPTLGGRYETLVQLPDGRECVTRLMTFLDGESIAQGDVTAAKAALIGSTLARLDVVLAGFEHPAGEHDLLWNVNQLPRMQPLLQYIGCDAARALAGRLLAHFTAEVHPRLALLPQQIIHNDFNRDNVFLRGDEVTGIIDFGDIMRAQRVLDPATLCAYLLEDADDPFRLARAAMRGYLEINPLADDELALLPELALGRRLLTLLIANWNASLWPDNAAYVLRSEPAARALLKRLAAFGRALADRFWEKAHD